MSSFQQQQKSQSIQRNRKVWPTQRKKKKKNQQKTAPEKDTNDRSTKDFLIKKKKKNYGHIHGKRKFPGQGLNPSTAVTYITAAATLDLLTYCAWLGTESTPLQQPESLQSDSETTVP